MTTTPSTQTPVVDVRTGRALPAWAQFFASLTSMAGVVQTVARAASPFTWKAPEKGYFVITGGAVTSVSITRGRVTVSFGTATRFPMSKDDAVTIIYTGTPTFQFLPS